MTSQKPPPPPPVATELADLPQRPPFDLRPTARALEWMLSLYELKVVQRGTSPPTWTCLTCERVTEAAPATALAFPHKPGCNY